MYCCVLWNGKILIHLNCFENKEVVFPKVSDIQVENVEYRYLFSIDNTKYFLCDMRLEDTRFHQDMGMLKREVCVLKGLAQKTIYLRPLLKTFGRLVSRY